MSKTYTTISGDMWDNIAYKEMGSCSWVNLLMSANSQYLKYFKFPAGIVLNIPEVQVRLPDTLPPWKR